MNTPGGLCSQTSRYSTAPCVISRAIVAKMDWSCTKGQERTGSEISAATTPARTSLHQGLERIADQFIGSLRRLRRGLELGDQRSHQLGHLLRRRQPFDHDEPQVAGQD